MIISPIDLSNPIFAPAMEAANTTLRVMIRRLMETNQCQGKLTLELKLELKEMSVTDPDSGEVMLLMQPSLVYKSGYQIPEKASIDGELEKGKVLFRDGEGWAFGDIPDNQMSML